ncbi:Annexin [Paragonimus heterotremus]|uniref:Annexin n=1 Tax=Paragonimus heterotremus TaxID=100268 RepID=A0A8J4T3A1_9TREM|nr:Annexin [Paragonimus heterotremus]
MYPPSDDMSAWNLGGQPPQGQYPGYPGGAPGYPAFQQGPYPGIQPGYPAAQPGYPGMQPGYPGQQYNYTGGPQGGMTQPGYGVPGAPGGQQMGYAPGQSGVGPGSAYGQQFVQPSMGAGPTQQAQIKTVNPTLKPYPYFKPDEDCEKLRKAMKGLGTDEKAIIDVLGHRTADQRAQLVQKYKAMYGKDLIADLKSELTGHFEDVVLAMCCTLDELDAKELRRAMEGAGTNEETLIEILCSRSNAQIRKIRETYSRLFDGRDLENDLESETHGHFKNVLVSLVQAKREENTNVDINAVQADAKALYDAGEKQLGTDESVFNRILVSKSEAYVRAVLEAYPHVAKKDIEDSLKSEMHGDLLRSFLAITRCIRSKPKYFAKQLKESMEGAGTNDKQLIRVVVSRAEIDMGDIKTEFMKAYGKSLEDWIADDTHGDYKRMLLALIS